MGTLGNLFRKEFGVEAEKMKVIDRSTPESRQFSKEYHEKVKKPQEAFERPLVDLDTLKKLFGQKMKENDLLVDSANKNFLKTLSYYFAEDERFNNSPIIKNKPSLKKGLFITGTYGFGKSITMQLFKECLKNTKNSFAYDSTISIVNNLLSESKKKTNDGSMLTKYMKGTWCFDDLGQEKPLYGQEAFEDILFERYSLFKKMEKKTHITSNMTIDKIETRYGRYISSRFNEMFNVIEVAGEDRRQ